MSPQLWGDRQGTWQQRLPAAPEHVEVAGHHPGPPFPFLAVRGAGGLDRVGGRLVDDPQSRLGDVQSEPGVVHRDVRGQCPKGVPAEREHLADDSDGLADSRLALFQPGLEPPVEALDTSGVVDPLLAGDRTDCRVTEMARRCPQRTGGQVRVRIREHHDVVVRGGDPPVDGLAFAQPHPGRQHRDAGASSRLRGGRVIRDNNDLKRAWVSGGG